MGPRCVKAENEVKAGSELTFLIVFNSHYVGGWIFHLGPADDTRTTELAALRNN